MFLILPQHPPASHPPSAAEPVALEYPKLRSRCTRPRCGAPREVSRSDYSGLTADGNAIGQKGGSPHPRQSTLGLSRYPRSFGSGLAGFFGNLPEGRTVAFEPGSAKRPSRVKPLAGRACGTFRSGSPHGCAMAATAAAFASLAATARRCSIVSRGCDRRSVTPSLRSLRVSIM